MKKRILVLCSALFVICVADAFSFGVGARTSIGGSYWGGGIMFTPAANDASSGVPLHFGFNFLIIPDYGNINITLDYWLFNPKITDLGSGALLAYAGFGLAASIGWGYNYLGAALRVPLGFDFDFDIVDVFIEAVPQVGVSLSPFAVGKDWIAIAVGVRVWF